MKKTKQSFLCIKRSVRSAPLTHWWHPEQTSYLLNRDYRTTLFTVSQQMPVFRAVLLFSIGEFIERELKRIVCVYVFLVHMCDRLRSIQECNSSARFALQWMDDVLFAREKQSIGRINNAIYLPMLSSVNHYLISICYCRICIKQITYWLGQSNRYTLSNSKCTKAFHRNPFTFIRYDAPLQALQWQ